MLPRKYRRVSAWMAGLALFALPAETQACWLTSCFGHQSRSTFYAPVAAAPACNTCVPQTVSYVPQTAYRPLLTTTPVTALRPVISTDPCTGCPTTVMQPTTAYMQRTVMMPYTTYRPIVQTSYYAPAVATPVCAAPACATGVCGTAVPATTYYQPATVAPAITAPAISQPACCGATSTPTTFGTPVSGATAAPSLGTAPAISSLSATTGRTFNNASESPADLKTNTTNTLKPIPDPEATKKEAKEESESPLKLLDPQNRTTSIEPVRSYMPVALKDRGAANGGRKIEKLDDSGWEAAR